MASRRACVLLFASLTVGAVAYLLWQLLSPGPLRALYVMGSGASPTWQSLSAYLDGLLGNSPGQILYRAVAGWTSLPIGTSGQVIASNGTVPVWGPASAVGAAGPAGAVQFNQGGFFTGTANIVWDDTNKILNLAAGSVMSWASDTGFSRFSSRVWRCVPSAITMLVWSAWLPWIPNSNRPSVGDHIGA